MLVLLVVKLLTLFQFAIMFKWKRWAVFER